MFTRLVDHHQGPEREALEGTETGTSGVKKVVEIGLTAQEIVEGTLGCGNHRIRDGFAGEERGELGGASRRAWRYLQEIAVESFPAVAAVARVN